MPALKVRNVNCHCRRPASRRNAGSLTVAATIVAQASRGQDSRRPTVRLNTSRPSTLSRSTQK